MLFEIIQSLSIEEYDIFKAYLRNKNKRKDIKNLTLLKHLRQGPPTKDIDVLIYGKPSKNAYYALCKHLYDNLIDFTATRGFETESTEELEVLKLILASRIFYEHRLVIPAQKTLRKAEIKGLDNDLYSMLSEIYHTQIQYAHLHENIDLEALFNRFQTNQNRYQSQENLNLAYAYIKNQLAKNRDIPTYNINELLEIAFQKFNIKIDDSLTFKSLFQLLEIANTVAHLAHNFSEALPFFKKMYDHIQRKKTSPQKHRFYHIYFLYFMANAYFRNRDFITSQNYLSQMQLEMHTDRKKYANRFHESYLLLKSLNLNYTGQAHQAIAILEAHFKNFKNNTPTKHSDLILALVIYYMQQERFDQALTQLNMLRHSDVWYIYKMGENWIIKRDLVQIIIHIELEHIDLVDSLLRRFKRNYKSTISKEVRLQHFLKMLDIVYRHPEKVEEVRFRESIKTLFTTENSAKEDIFMMSYFAWLLSKNSKNSLYQTTLNLLIS